MAEEKKSLGGRIKAAFRKLRSDPQPRRTGRRTSVTFGLMYDQFREILSLNNATLEMYADFEEKLSGRRPFTLDTVAQRVRKAALDVFVMVKNLNQLTRGRQQGLYEALQRMNSAIEAELARAQRQVPAGPLVLPLDELCATDARRVGNKMANLGEVRRLELRIPRGFAISTRAFSRFMVENDLWPRGSRLESLLETEGPRVLGEACEEVHHAIVSAPVPSDVAQAILESYEATFAGADVPVALRSSAVGEDSSATSHAGLYTSRLHVRRDGLLAAYREVVASAFGPSAVSYRFERGLSFSETSMGVGCVEMVDARASGILFSRSPDDPAADVVVIGATAGIAEGVASGRQDAELILVEGGRVAGPAGELRDAAQVAALAQTARRLEAHFGQPQDVEWAIDRAGALFLLQSRPMIVSASEGARPAPPPAGHRPLLEGGRVAAPGVGCGPVVHFRADSDLDDFPAGGVLVSRYASPKFARVMRLCAAILTDVGSPIGHMAILAREFRVPTIVGIGEATRRLQAGQVVTVDAAACRVFAGRVALAAEPAARTESAEAPRTEDGRTPLADSPTLQALERLLPFIVPLNLTDPAAPDFTPAGCRSLHDITRYVHEKVFEVMFHYGDLAEGDQDNSVKLVAHLPIDVRIFDVGGGIEGDVPRPGKLPKVKPERISSVPLRAFLEGLQDSRIRWDLPRPVSMRGFLSVLGESIAAPPPEAQKIGRTSYAIVSDRYMNFSTKAGYHFSTVDTFCDEAQNKNYIHFRFAGGAADENRRYRRVRFLGLVLEPLDFNVLIRGDLLVARLDKADLETTRTRLADLGRLTLCVRQMDMLMDSDAMPELFARAFLDGEWHRF